jgi:hypothetical protein
MPRACSCCVDPRRPQIDRDLLSGLSEVKTSQKYGKSSTSVERHKQHITQTVALAASQDYGRELMKFIEVLEGEAARLQADAEAAHDTRTAIVALGERRRLVELRAKITGELKEHQTTTNILSVTLDPKVAERMAEAFLMRQKLLKADGGHVN